ncbi:MAG TPA: hypothetical protein VKA73_13235 [Rubrobacter sp.]|nr:hypothetical protein [Rubrobacter sp.]
MTEAPRARIEPAPTPEEAAAIVAALEALGWKKPESGLPARSRWRLAGMLGHPVPPGMKLEGALWSYSSWEGGL